jgi:hypothetical protein
VCHGIVRKKSLFCRHFPFNETAITFSGMGLAFTKTVWMTVNNANSFFSELADQPIRLDRVSKPLLRPSFADAASDRRCADQLTIWVK